MGDCMKKLFCILLSCVMMLLAITPFYAEEVKSSAEAYVLYCAASGEVLLSDNADTELPIASITKIMTTLLTLEYAEKDNKVVEFTDEMTAEGSSMYLKKGEKVTLYDLAVGMMMQSGNDAANASAITIAGSIEDFAALMNDKAKEIGMAHTHFVTPSGLDDPEHYSTARDMALLMAHALQNKDFAYITSQSSMTVNFIYPADKFITYPNHNKLLRMYEDCIGGKTGYTDASGRTLVSAAKRDGMTLIAVTLNDRDDWDDHIALYEYGFENYKAVKLNPEQNDSLNIVGGVQDSVPLYADKTAVVVKSSDKIEEKICLPSFLYAPVEKGESVGKIIYTLEGKTLTEIPLKVAQTVDYNNTKRSFIQYIKDIFKWHS